MPRDAGSKEYLNMGRIADGTPIRRLCANDREPAHLVPPGRYKFCSRRCGDNVRQREVYWQKRKEPNIVRLTGREQCQRVHMRSAADILESLEYHAETHGVCPIGNKQWGGWCPGRTNPQSLRAQDWTSEDRFPGRCIIFATLQDDYMDRRVKDSKEITVKYERRWTDWFGFWLQEPYDQGKLF